jgi:MFS family permease
VTEDAWYKILSRGSPKMTMNRQTNAAATSTSNPATHRANTISLNGRVPRRHLRKRLPEVTAFWVLAALFLMFFFASAAASPLYRRYQANFRFSSTTLTTVFAVYVLVLLITLLLFGSVSDYLGRRPVITVALILSAASCLLFLMAHGVGALYGARCLQGVATGLATGPIGAALIALQPSGTQRAPLVTSAFSTLGLALGALLTAVLVEYGPEPTHLIWWSLLAVFAAGIAIMVVIPEPGAKRRGVLASVRPRIAVPRDARKSFAQATPCFVATWALAGLYLSLGPSIAAQTTGSQNAVWGGLVIFLICGTGSVTAFLLRRIQSHTAMFASCLCLLVGVAITFAGIAASATAAFLTGTAVAGAGYGLAFLGAFRMTTALATPSQSAALLAAVFVVSYFSFGVPAVIAGFATTKFGLRPTALVYSALLAVLVAVSIRLLWVGRGERPGREKTSREEVSVRPQAMWPCPPSVDSDSRRSRGIGSSRFPQMATGERLPSWSNRIHTGGVI